MIELFGTLQVESGGSRAQLTGAGRELRLEIDDPAVFFRTVSQSRRRGLEALRLLADGLRRSGLTLRISCAGEEFLVLGEEAQSGTDARLLRVPHLEVRDRRVLLRWLWAR